jgi:hypothetical protein
VDSALSVPGSAVPPWSLNSIQTCTTKVKACRSKSK